MTHGSLTDGFEYYLPPTPEQTMTFLNEAMVVVDTNVLLNLYRYNEQAREDLLKVLAALDDRLFVTHQIAYEFWERREAVISDASRMSERFAAELASKAEPLFQHLNEWKNRVSPPKDIAADVRAKLETAIDEAAERVRSLDTAVPAEAGRDVEKDEVLGQLLPLLEGRVGSAPDETTSQQDDAEAARRATDDIPPGFKDKKKSGDRPFGDYRVWAQSTREAIARGMKLLIVTDDRKEDWWHMHGGQRSGPRREILAEFAGAGGEGLLLMTPATLLFSAREALGVDIADESVRTAKTVRGRTSERAVSSSLEKMPSGRDGRYAKHILTMTRCVRDNPDTDSYIDAFQSCFPSITRSDEARRRTGTLIVLGLAEWDGDTIQLTKDGRTFAADGDVELLRGLFMRRIEHAPTIRDLALQSPRLLSDRILYGPIGNLNPTQRRRVYTYMLHLGLIPSDQDDSGVDDDLDDMGGEGDDDLDDEVRGDGAAMGAGPDRRRAS